MSVESPADNAPVVPSESEGVTDRFRQLLIGITLLVGSTLSLTLSLQQWFEKRALLDFVTKNVMEFPARKHGILLTLSIGAAVGAGLSIAGLLRKPLAPKIFRWGKIACPLLVTSLLPSLFLRDAWAGPAEIKYLVLLGATGLVLEQLLYVSLAELGPPAFANAEPSERLRRILRWLPFALVCVGALYYAILVSRYTIACHIRLTTATADLGEYDNQFYNSLHGHPFRLPASEGDLHDWSALKFHADFIIYFLLPFYALKPGPEVLLVIQSVMVAFTAIPIYLFGERRLPRWIAALVALAFLLLPVVERPNFYDFHAVPIGMFFVAWAIWFVDRIVDGAKRKRDYALFWAAFALACLSREDIAFGMMIVSAFLLFSGRAPRLSVTMLAIATAYFIAIKFLIMPRVGLSWYDNIYDDIKSQGAKGYGAVVMTLLSNPVFVVRSMITEPKLLYVLHMTAPLLFLWVRRPYLLTAAVPSVFFTLMVTNRAPMFETSFQYAFQWFPYVVIASILALRHMATLPRGNVKQTAAAVSLALVASGVGFQYGVLLGGKKIVGGFGEKRVDISAFEWGRYRDLHALTARIPREASVAATEAEGAHVATRLILYNIRFGLGADPDYILFNRDLGRAEADRVRQSLEAGKYGVVDQRGPFVLLKRGYDTKDNPKVIEQLKHH